MSESEPPKASLHAVVEGHVQGVGFRAFVKDRAERLGLTGWVRNRWDGTVEVMAEGERPALDRLLTGLYAGPRPYTSMGVRADWGEYTGKWNRFSVVPTE